MKKTILASSLLLLSVSLYAKPFTFCPDKCGIYDSAGYWIAEPIYDSIDFFDADATFHKVKQNKKFGYIDSKGHMIIAPKYKYAGNFSSNGLVHVFDNGKWGYIDAKGTMVIAPQFSGASPFCTNGLANVILNGKHGFINDKGVMVIKPQFDYAYGFISHDLSAIKHNGKYGYIDTKGDIVIPLQFEDANDFAPNGLARIKQNGKYGFINDKGVMVISPQLDYAGDFSISGLANMTKNGRYGYINAKGEVTIPAQFEDASIFLSNGLAKVKQNGKYGFIDTSGKFVIPPEFIEVDTFLQDYKDIWKMKHKDKRWMIYDITTKSMLISYKLDEKKIKYDILNANGEVIWPKLKKEKTISKKSEPINSNVNKGVVSKNGIATNNATDLMWQDDNDVERIKHRWKDAKQYCENLKLDERDDWRVPNIYELSTLLDNTKSKEPYSLDGFSKKESSRFWSSTTMQTNPIQNAKSINVYAGKIEWTFVGTSLNIRCVRGKELSFVDVLRLKKSGKINVSQENIDNIAPK